MRTAIFLATVLAASSAIATEATVAASSNARSGQAPLANIFRYSNQASVNDYNYLEGVALNASAGARTVAVETGGYKKLRVVFDFVYAAATTVVLTPSCSLDGGNTYGRESSTSVNAGAGTLSAYADTYTTGAANITMQVVYDVEGCTNYKIVFSGASAGATDLVDVQLTAVVGS